jgi:transposase
VEEQIIELHQQRVGREDIRRQLHCSPNRITRAIAEWRDSGHAPAPLHMGPPKKVTGQIVTFIEAQTLQNARLAGTELVHEICQRFGVTIHPTTIWKVRNGLQFNYQRPRHVQALTEVQMSNRVAFCEKMLDFPPKMLSAIAFSDETRIVIGDDKQWVWYRKGENNPSANVATEKFAKSVMAFAVIGKGYKSKLLFVEGNINGDKYMENIEKLEFIKELNTIHGEYQWIFQQDGAPCHTKQEVVDWLEESVDLIVDWPANSPDLNPIELLWAVLKSAVRKFRPQTIEALKAVLQAAWNCISQRTIDLLTDSFPARLQACLDADGRSISNDLCRMSDIKQCIEEDWAQRGKKWTVDDDAKLTDLHFIYGIHWQQIQMHFTDRTKCQLRCRWGKVRASKEYLAMLEDKEALTQFIGAAHVRWARDPLVCKFLEKQRERKKIIEKMMKFAVEHIPD